MTALRIALPIAPATETHCGSVVGGCPKLSCGQCCAFNLAYLEWDVAAEMLRRLPECIQATLPAEPWTEQRPTEGRWWLALEMAQRRGISQPDRAMPVYIDARGFVYRAGTIRCLGRIGTSLFVGAKWMRREQPADPFAGGE